MAAKTSLVAFALASLSGAALAGMEFRFPAAGEMPHYFSGANNRISAHPDVTGQNEGITAWELWLTWSVGESLGEEKTACDYEIPAPLHCWLGRARMPPGRSLAKGRPFGECNAYDEGKTRLSHGRGE